VDVLVTDTGPGITSPHLARILAPMFTTRTAQGNRGLGLTIAHAISRFLRNTGYSVKVAEGGAEALALRAERSYDLILLGLRMKEMTGEPVYELLASRHPEQAGRCWLTRSRWATSGLSWLI
jgi:hypothetical protein